MGIRGRLVGRRDAILWSFEGQILVNGRGGSRTGRWSVQDDFQWQCVDVIVELIGLSVRIQVEASDGERDGESDEGK